ncbi:hypothetical protein ACFYOD_37045 [Streptomyces sp. NPDC006703]|uniref:hypothetical protein n=1 Tax=Streptomyces sp. NPDC006703 TaxID=3364759 RepID=UPI0036ACFD5C
MEALYPDFIDRLLSQGRDPHDIPVITAGATTDWLTRFAPTLLALLDQSSMVGPPGPYLAQHHVHLPLRTGDGPSLVLRVASSSAMAAWPVTTPTVVLTLAGTVELEMYRQQEDMEAGRPQYTRRFGPWEVFAAHPGTLCALQSSTGAVHILATGHRPGVPGERLPVTDADDAVARARAVLEAGVTVAGQEGTPVKAQASWLDDVPSLDLPDLRSAERISRDVLNRLANDRALISRLVDEIPHDAERLANSRVTLLLNRLSLYQATGRGFEIRMNMNPRPANQLIPHDHCYDFATRILTGGYVHVVRRRCDGGQGPFSADDLELGIVTVERPGSAYTLGHQMVHQAVMEPDTVTLFIRGPRRKRSSNSVAAMVPPRESWPAPAEPHQDPAESRPATLAEYHLMRQYLHERRLID